MDDKEQFDFIRQFLEGSENKKSEPETYEEVTQIVGGLVNGFKKQGFSSLESITMTMQLFRLFYELSYTKGDNK